MNAGEVASSLAVEAVQQFVESSGLPNLQVDDEENISKELEEAFQHVHARILGIGIAGLLFSRGNL